MLKLVLIIALSTLTSCQGRATQTKNSSEPALQQGNLSAVRAEALCNRLSEIKRMPVKREPIDDEVFNGLMSLKESAVPCLIERLADVRPMEDPRGEPTKSFFFTVGDAAFFTLIRIVDVPLDMVFPQEIKKRWTEEGLYAYFRYVEQPKNRNILKENFKRWWAETTK